MRCAVSFGCFISVSSIVEKVRDPVAMDRFYIGKRGNGKEILAGLNRWTSCHRYHEVDLMLFVCESHRQKASVVGRRTPYCTIAETSDKTWGSLDRQKLMHAAAVLQQRDTGWVWRCCSY